MGAGSTSLTALGKAVLALSRGPSELADRLVTMAPDVTTTTSLAGFVNKRGTFTTGEGALAADVAPDSGATDEPLSIPADAESGAGPEIDGPDDGVVNGDDDR